MTKLPEVFIQWAFNPKFVLLENAGMSVFERTLHVVLLLVKVTSIFLVALYFISSLELYVSDFIEN